MSTLTTLSQADVETRIRSWAVRDAAGDLVVVDAMKFYARLNRSSTPIVWTTDGAGGSIAGVVDNGDGTGTWTVTAGNLPPADSYDWWALATVGAEEIIPTALEGTFRITDR